MKRRLLTFGSVISVLLCAGTAGLWVRSAYRVDLAWGSVGRLFCDVESSSGTISVQVVNGYRWREPPHFFSFPVGADERAHVDLPLMAITMGEFKRWRKFGLSGDYGLIRAELNANGTVKRSWEQPLSGESSERMRYWNVEDIPHWTLCLLTLLLPLTWLFSLVRDRRRAPHVCKIWGYDLRASPERCPECGTVVPGMKKAHV